ncbi:DUF4259 domain-containing protein [Streptomyces sp. NPDC048192]|uniref:DUF4259 domain-containing protein n=1 Tax=Streptomyces sp. NPDC048192 TaxID=3365510 RepID=UPI00371D4A08
MGTWDTGHFDNDAAADFSHRLDQAAAAERESIVRRALVLTIDAQGYLDSDVAAEAVAAAALVGGLGSVELPPRGSLPSGRRRTVRVQAVRPQLCEDPP